MAFVAVPPMMLPPGVALIQVEVVKLDEGKVSLKDATEHEVNFRMQKLRSTGVGLILQKALISVIRDGCKAQATATILQAAGNSGQPQI